MKIAIIHDHLTCKAGGEQVALSFHKAFPEAPIFTLAYDINETYEEFQGCTIYTSVFQKISIKERSVKRLFFPFGLIAAKLMDVRGYDIVLMSTTHCAKYVRLDKKCLVFCYAHNPFRLAWYPEEYESYRNSKHLKRVFFDFVLGILRKIDKNSIGKVNYLITNSNVVAQRLKAVYDNYKGEIEVIPPPVKIEQFSVSSEKGDYFLIVSRLESYKKVDMAIEVFNDLGLPLVVVGKGIMEDKLKSLAFNNIRFLKDLSSVELAKVYRGAKAFIFPQLEDFGITPLEANASGIPVIAYGEGGVLDTQIPYNEDNQNIKATAIFYLEQEKECLKNSILRFLELESKFDREYIRANAKNFDEMNFINKIQNYIKEKSH